MTPDDPVLKHSSKTMKNVFTIASLLTFTACGQATLARGSDPTSQASPVASQAPSEPSAPVVQGAPSPVQTAADPIVAEPNSVNGTTDSNTVNANNCVPVVNGIFDYNCIKVVQIGMNPNSFDSTGNVDGCNVTTGPAGQYMYWRSGATGFTSVSNGIATWSQTTQLNTGGTWTTVYTFYPDGSAQQLWRRSATDSQGPCLSVINSARAYIISPTGYETYSNFNH